MLGQFGPSFYDVRVSKTGSPRGGAKGFGWRPAPRLVEHRVTPRVSEASTKEKENLPAGQLGPGLYDVKCFQMGWEAKGTPRFVPSKRFDRNKCYEGKARCQFGQFGPTGVYDAPMCSNRGSPLWKNRPSAAFALPHVRRPSREA